MIKVMLGGSFNPVTNAHLAMIKCLQTRLNAEVLIVPNGDNYPRKDLVAFHHRIQMLELALKGVTKVKILEIENKRLFQGTVTTLRELNHPYMAIGADSLIDLPSWVNFEDLIKENKFIVFDRANSDVLAFIQADERLKPYQNHFQTLECDIPAVSSTAFRKSLDANMVHPAVFQYIKENNLY